MRLNAMPKALGFEDKSKGFFPHKFSLRDHLKYVGPYPPPSDYGVERMSLAEREEFLCWHGEASRGVFNFEKESLYYCQNDVNILREACIKFRDGFIGETNVDPFSCVTIASACMKIFLTNFLPKNTLAIPSPDNYGRTSKAYSHASIQWLELVAHSQKIPIQHALTTGGEKKIGPYFVDGYALIDGEKWVWEFLGCFYHSCPKCYRPEEICPLTCTPYGDLHASTEARLRELRNVYRVRTVTLWEHEWSEMKKSDEEVKKFLQSYEAPEPLSPRSGLYGGRTSALRLHYSASPGENVYYVDVTSLYPAKKKDVALIQWSYNECCVIPPGASNNVFIAAFTTAYARLKLYEYLEKLQRNVLYTNTDSLIYVVKEGEEPLELGNYLGDLTDELDGDTIQEFVSAGPKSYAYRTRNKKKLVVKMKGITQTRECCERVNFDSMSELVESYLSGMKKAELETPQHGIQRDKRGFVLKNRTFQKKFRMVYDKRRLFPDGTTLPFGY
ncbi:unnamed protein product [Oreochromis niloticus]|nr:unnamed protein product [Mustela putorius furo]